MKKYEFKLAAAYSLYAGAFVGWQRGSSVIFVLKQRVCGEMKNLLRKAFEDYVRFVRKQRDCPKVFFEECRVSFVYVSGRNVRSVFYYADYLKRGESGEKRCLSN